MDTEQRETVVKDLTDLLSLLKFSEGFASKKPFYHELDRWREPLITYIESILRRNGFVDGDIEANREKPLVMIWENVYELVNNIHKSKYLVTEEAEPKRASAFEFNKALMEEIKDIILQCKI